MLKRSLLLLWLAAVAVGCHASYARHVRIPVSSAAVPDLSGTWNSRWGEDYVAVLFVKQEGERVTATYTTTARLEQGVEGTIEGSFEGRLAGNELRGTWEEGGARFGRFRFVFAADGRAFEGTWGRKELEDDGGTWNGAR
ncbi:MAG: hypothetical protein Q8L48_12615 [Archangium sp.]|nr:hypothetical protein [Archangium sp.]